jgi:hypothetical protein
MSQREVVWIVVAALVIGAAGAAKICADCGFEPAMSRSPMEVVLRPARIDTSRFESSLPSQPKGSHPGDYPRSTKSRHFRGLAAKSRVSGGEF